VECKLLTVLNLPADAGPKDVAAAVAEAWPGSKVVHVRGPRPSCDLRDFYWTFFELIGSPLPFAEDAAVGDRNAQRTGGYWFEVRYDPSVPDAYRHSANAQPLHTDLSYIPVRGGTGFLGCVAMPDEGGATTFVDADDVIAALREDDPDLLHELERTSLPHARSGDRRVENVIRYEGGKPLLNWNYYCVDPEVGADGQDLRERFFEFLTKSRSIADRTIRVKLSPGEAVLWKDEQVLHGRDSFNADAPSERFLWKSQLLIDA
jgi:alpha-ketoglutarate-dependent taurine dioxygenase